MQAILNSTLAEVLAPALPYTSSARIPGFCYASVLNWTSTLIPARRPGGDLVQLNGGLVDHIPAQAVGQGGDVGTLPGTTAQRFDKDGHRLADFDVGDVPLAQVGGLDLQVAQVSQGQHRLPGDHPLARVDVQPG